MSETKMQLTRIEPENAEAYSTIIPEEILYDEEYVKLGVVDEEGYACAGCAVMISGDLAYLDWIYTRPSYRGRGAATMLIAELIKLLDGLQLAGIASDFSVEDDYLEEFFMEQEFLTGMDNEIYRVPMVDLLYSPEMDTLLESRSSDSLAGPVDDKAKMKGLVDFFEKNDLNVAILADITPSLSIINTDKNGEVTGCLLIGQLNEKDLKVHSFVNNDTVKGAIELIIALYDVLTEKEDTHEALVFTDRSQISVSFVEKLTGYERDVYRVQDRIHAVKLFA